MLLQSQSKRAGHSRAVEPDDQLSDVSGMGYVALSRVGKSEDIKILTPIVADQLTPALT